MWQLIFLRFAAAFVNIHGPMESDAIEQQRAQETKNMNPNFAHALGADIKRTIGQTLAIHAEEFEKRFANLENLCREGNSAQTDINLISEDMESQVQEMVAGFESKLLRFSMNAVEEVEAKMVVALDRALADIDVILQPVKEEITSLSNKMSMLVTQDEVAGLQTKLTTLATNAATEIKTEVGNLPTKEDLQNQSRLLGEVTDLVDNMKSCGDSETVQQVLEQLMISDKDLGELSELLNDSSQNSQCNSNFATTVGYLESLKSIIDVNKEALVNLGDSLGNMRNTFSTRLEDLENVTQIIVESVQTPTEIPTTTTSTTSTTTTRPPTTTTPPPCLDSNFIGAGRSLDVCEAAVRFRKCHLDFVAFHCCRSCHDAGLISSIPNYNASRNVPVLQALKSLRPG